MSNRGPEAGFSMPELMVAMAITLTLMTIVFTVMRQNQNIFATETGVTSMNENVRASIDLLTREVQAAGTGLRGMTAPILGVDSRGERGDRLAILIGDPYAPVAAVRPGVVGTNGVNSVALSRPVGLAPEGPGFAYRDDRGRLQQLYEPGDRYVLYRESQFLIVRVSGASRSPSGDIIVTFAPDESNPRPRFGDYRYDHSVDGNGALFARLDSIVYYRFDREAQTLERRENREPWAEVARGILGFQVRYRVVEEDETLSEPLGEPPTERAAIRSVVVTLRARTPDVGPDSPYYRETAERVEITPRNMRIPRNRPGELEPPPA
jgi:prepilin-type N-terminal cleavage/methylation domain-containing protein